MDDDSSSEEETTEKTKVEEIEKIKEIEKVMTDEPEIVAVKKTNVRGKDLQVKNQYKKLHKLQLKNKGRKGKTGKYEEQFKEIEGNGGSI